MRMDMEPRLKTLHSLGHDEKPSFRRVLCSWWHYRTCAVPITLKPTGSRNGGLSFVCLKGTSFFFFRCSPISLSLSTNVCVYLSLIVCSTSLSVDLEFGFIFNSGVGDICSGVCTLV